MKHILVAYVNGTSYTPPVIDFENVDLSYIPTTIQYHLTLNPNNPDELAVLDMLQNEIKYGYVNAFIKALIRAYVPRIPFIGYGVNNGFVTRRINAIDVGVAIREAAKEEFAKVSADEVAVSDITLDTKDSAASEIATKQEAAKDLATNKSVVQEQQSAEDEEGTEDFDAFLDMAQAFTEV